MNRARSAALALTSSIAFALSACSSSSDAGSPPAAPGAPGAATDAGADSSNVGVAPDSGASPGDAAGSADAGPFVEAPHRPFPNVVYGGAGLLTAPKVVTVTFKGDALAPQLEAFGASAASSSWWDAIRPGYCETGGTTCVGDGPAGTSVELPTAAAATYTDSSNGGPSTLQSFIASQIGTTLPAPDASTLYLFYFPASTTITSDGDVSCQAFDGYHGQMTVGSKQVAYAVVDECAPPNGLTLAQFTTAVASHEIAEAATDPFGTSTTSGYYLDLGDPSSFAWNDLGGGEVGDLCVDFFGRNQDVTTEGAFTVQRIWSNESAAAGHDPCVPAPASTPYFNAAPARSFFVLDVGQSATFEVDAFSDAPRGDWTLTATDVTNPNTTYLTFAIAGATTGSSGPSLKVNNGSKVQVTVTLKADPGGVGSGEADGLLVSADGDSTSATAIHSWPIGVMSTVDAIDAGIDAAAGHAVHARRPGRGRRR